MPERENFALPLSQTDFNIAGNVLRAYRDANNHLAFVIDYTITDEKPNALLVMHETGNRKWDDVLANDYDINLENIRPKKDNKYQKLDIEYSGLEIYDELINDFTADADVSESLNKLNSFRTDSARRAAQERLNTAETTISNANDTITKANETLSELNDKHRDLRSKLSELRGNIGREPTKQSAAKILRVESQIDSVNDKISRTQKRIANAQRRLNTATADADVARQTLGTVPEKTKAMDMTEKIEPLFDKDPEIIDESIAFKPISFGSNNAPLSFTPPTSDYSEPESVPDKPTMSQPAPVLDTITPIIDTNDGVETAPVIEPIVEPMVEPEPTQPVMETLRPALPVVEQESDPVVTQPTHHHSKPGLTYYILLIVLIVLSIFTLWLYQKSTTPSTTPELLVEKSAPVKQVQESIDDTDMQIIIATSKTSHPQDVVVPESAPEVIPELVGPDTIPAPIVIETTIAPAPIDEPELVTVTEPTIIPEPIIKKPDYNISGPTQLTEIDEDTLICSDGNAPDKNGCCAGEVFTQLDDGVACCTGDECFPPMM
ncbi:MAG: hypothetical protein MJ170_04280 [Alphaproteobacteria bacterium]|nr:hypothetical protein [Alphaproteobacteria bacterium]